MFVRGCIGLWFLLGFPVSPSIYTPAYHLENFRGRGHTVLMYYTVAWPVFQELALASLLASPLMFSITFPELRSHTAFFPRMCH